MVTGSVSATHSGGPNGDRKCFCYAQGVPNGDKKFFCYAHGVP